MRTVALSIVLVAFGVAGCATEPPDASDDTAAAISAKHLQYKQVDITAGPATHDGCSPAGCLTRAR